MRVTALLCEHQTNPLGIDAVQPRLSWQLTSGRRGARQSAYQIVVAATDATLLKDGPFLWDSGKVASDQSIHVPYGGPLLPSRQRAWWRVRVWDERGEPSDYSELAWWELGLLSRDEWLGQWIGAPLVGGPRTSIPCPFLRKRFEVTGEIAEARLYVTALGLYEIEINGRRVGEDCLTPGWTDYRQRVQYQVYDVRESLCEGPHVIGAILGDGWYCGHVAWLGRQQYGDQPKLLAQLMIRFADGRELAIATDKSWKTAFGPLLASDLLMGESYDARLVFHDWSQPGFDDSAWQPAQSFPDPGIALTARRGPAVRRVESVAPVAGPVEGRRSGRWIFDLGQNMVGRVRLKVSGPAGTTVTIRHGEALDTDGELYTANLRTALQTDHYTLNGEGEEAFEPRFTFHGFRYVELSGYPGRPPRDAVNGIVLHSDLPPAGNFSCSDTSTEAHAPLINQLQHNIVWGLKGNFVDIPTDCPQRDERLGWTGDAQVFIRTATFNRDVAGFFSKWLQDLADAQSEAGAFPKVAPDPGLGADGGPAWADAGIICPWVLYLAYGDCHILKRHYPAMQRFLDFQQRSSRDFIRCHPEAEGWCGYGDWLAINADTPKDLIGTAFFAHCARLMSQIALVLDKEEDAARYEELFENVRQAFIHRFVTPDGLLAAGTQTAYVLALHFDLLPEALRPAAVEALVRDIEQRRMRLSTGFVGTPYLLPVLADMGRLDIAYALLRQTSWPSWLYPVTQGATTIWERWDGWTEEKGFQDPSMNSFNHYAFGAVGAWLYTTVAGIDTDVRQPGYKHILLRPRPGGDLTSARGTHHSPYGLIVSDWHLEDERFYWDLVIPPNTTATAYIPAAEGAAITESGGPAEEAEGVTFIRREEATAIYELTAGVYHFRANVSGP